MGGRGTVVFVRGDDGEWALRHYRRGGVPGRLLEDHYLWLGAGRTRAFREWRLLRRLHGAGLPVPRPIAARYRRDGLGYTADLITARVPAAEPLAARVGRAPLAPDDWRRVGRCLREFHEAGVCHPDLNAHNLLLDATGAPWLLDFDRGRLRPPGAWRRRNLDRFLRSLNKIRAAQPGLHVGAPDWAALLDGYSATPAR